MKIELKKIKTNLAFSEETIMFNAEVCINGVVVGTAQNDGRGGCTYYGANGYGLSDEIRERNKTLIKQAEEFCKALPKTKYLDLEFDQSLESVIDDLVSKHLEEKEAKKLEKKMETHIMWGVPKGNSYVQVKFKTPLSAIPIDKLQTYVNKYKLELKKGEVFLNTNFERLGIKI